MTKPKTKKPIPLDGNFLSMGVLIEGATAEQLNIEVGRLLKVAAQRCAERGVKIDQDEFCKKALIRSMELMILCNERLLAEAEAAGIAPAELELI